MATLAPKLILTPLLIASASLAGRRWGAALSGWLVALPLTSGPIAVFIALDLGVHAGADAAAGSLVGAVAQIAFALAYAGASSRLGWPGSLALATVAFAATAIAVPAAAPAVLFAATLAGVAIGLPFLLPRGEADVPGPRIIPSRWDIPVRALVATVLVVAISGAAPVVGGHAAGVIATFPVYISVLTTFAHVLGGAAEARLVLMGLVAGLPGFATFFLVAGALLEPLGILPAFAIALASAVGVNLASLALLRRRLA